MSLNLAFSLFKKNSMIWQVIQRLRTLTQESIRAFPTTSKKLKLKTSTFIVPKCSFYMAGCKNKGVSE